MTPTPSDMDARIAAYLTGNCTEEERAWLQDWALASPKNRQMLQQAERAWMQSDQAQLLPDHYDVELAWNQVAQKLETRKRSQRIVTLRQYAAAAAVLLLLSLMFWWQKSSSEPAYVQIETQDFQADFLLPDGSRVWLNEYSSLRYAEAFETRDVHLEGEAFFEVRRNETLPFRVLSRDVTTQVLGTSFNVRAYSQQTSVEVAVRSGKVQVQANSEQVILEAGEAARYQNASQALLFEKAADANADAWKTGLLRFEDHSLLQVVQILQRQFDTVIQLENNALENCRFTGAFEDASLDEVLQVLAFGLNLELHTRQDTLLLQGAGCQ